MALATQVIACPTIREPDVPVVANIDARLHTDPDDWGGILSDADLTALVAYLKTLK